MPGRLSGSPRKGEWCHWPGRTWHQSTPRGEGSPSADARGWPASPGLEPDPQQILGLGSSLGREGEGTAYTPVLCLGVLEPHLSLRPVPIAIVILFSKQRWPQI